MDKPLDEIIKEEKEKNKSQRKGKKLPQKKGAQGFRRGDRDNRKPREQERRKLVIKKRVQSSGNSRDNPARDPNQLRVLNLDYNITESELRVSPSFKQLN